MPWWVNFFLPITLPDGREVGAACVDSGSKTEALVVAMKLGQVRSINSLPYPAQPRLHGPEKNDCPSFCFAPNDCSGRTCCPRSYACSE